MLDQPHHQLFLRRQVLGHQQRQRDQRVVVDELIDRARQQVLIQAQIP